ncbi:AMP-binding protein [Streptomyces umbrinus]|uniref:AMP-binding protein n=1 Tax=Streptomyces umbrinus TaxID=67370 RepID=UPI003435FC9F
MRTIWDVVHEQAQRDPEATAAMGVHRYSYRELIEHAVGLSEAIGRLATRGSLMALDMDSPLSGAVAILAAARAGCAVLPLNRQSPPEHRKMILADARPSLLVSAAAECEFDVEELEYAADADDPLRDVAYVIYTSGSTGIPKGVMVGHNALLDRLSGLAHTPGLAAGESMVAMTSLSFDISMAEMLLPLTVGARLLAAPSDARLDPDVFVDFLDTYVPDVVQATPSFWRLVATGTWNGASGSRIWCGGEALSPALARRLVPACKELWNLYGPTEATIWATAALINADDTITLGSPLPDSFACLDNVRYEESAEGEILLYGAGLAKGYLRRPQLTSERFCHRQTPHGLMLVYRTGDRARQQADGSLVFLGREDGQIKLRGHRIELGEIESALEEHPKVSQAVTLLRDSERPDRASIVAFVVAEQTSGAEIKRWLLDRLPPSHSPAHIAILSSLPRTAAGKVDRVALACSESR